MELAGLPDCGACTRPDLLPGNAAAWDVIQATGGALFDGMGGIRLTNARLAAEVLDYPFNEDLLHKVLAYASDQLAKDENDGEAGDQVDAD